MHREPLGIRTQYVLLRQRRSGAGNCLIGRHVKSEAVADGLVPRRPALRRKREDGPDPEKRERGRSCVQAERGSAGRARAHWGTNVTRYPTLRASAAKSSCELVGML